MSGQCDISYLIYHFVVLWAVFILPGIIKLTVSNTQNNLESVLKLQIFKQGYGKTTSRYITSNYMPQIACFKKTLFLNYSFNDKSLYLIFLYAKTGCFEKITIHCKFFCNFFIYFTHVRTLGVFLRLLMFSFCMCFCTEAKKQRKKKSLTGE